MLRLAREVTEKEEVVWLNGNTHAWDKAAECAKKHSSMSRSLPRKAYMFVGRNPGTDLHSPPQVKEIQEALDASLIRWLSSLKARAEPAVV